MAQATDPRKVVCSGEGLRVGYVNRATDVHIDTRNAGPGSLAVYCEGMKEKAYCELRDHGNGTFSLNIRPKEAGTHTLSIKYNEIDVPGSPYSLHVSNASLLHVRGPGLEDGVIDKHKGEFLIETEDAGPGDIKIRVGGPKGSFKQEVRKDGRKVLCKYHPKQTGEYIIEVRWMGNHVPGSPFHVLLCRTHEEYEQYKHLSMRKRKSGNPHDQGLIY